KFPIMYEAYTIGKDMPIYEYHCPGCNKEVSIFFLTVSEAEAEKPACPECGSRNLGRLISNISAVSKPDNAKKKDAPEKSPAAVEDTAALARVMRDEGRKSKTGYGEQFGEVTARLEKGESSESIEKSLRKRVGETMETPH
ncbi:MAG TPA: zinc ribbon domain-containing protein, partial [Thermodesulfobacteriota bacterium]|nr:zinc ribbon domain-containing protein [Thermodesulfobacteriota bacterium]